jgi:hypothetical protein
MMHLPGLGVGVGLGGFGVGLGLGGFGVGLGLDEVVGLELWAIAVTLQKPMPSPAPTSKTRVILVNWATEYPQVETVISFFIIFRLPYVSQRIQ